MIEQEYGDVRYLQFDQFSQFPEITHGVFTRLGGYSPAPYQSLNMSRNAGGDSIDNVICNRELALQALDIVELPCINLWQIHGAEVFTYRTQDEWRTDWGHKSYFELPWTPQTARKGDSLITQESEVAVAFSFADCIPIVFYDALIQVIGVAHGGWRGSARGVVLATVAAMQEQFGSRPENIYAGIGPGIGPCCYEISAYVQDIFTGRKAFDEDPTRPEYRSRVRESAVFSTRQLPDQASLRIDLQETNRNQLLMTGVLAEHIEVMRICTGCNTDRFFSHRQENGQTGRFAVIIALTPQR